MYCRIIRVRSGSNFVVFVGRCTFVPLNHELEASTKKINYGYKVTFPFVDSY